MKDPLDKPVDESMDDPLELLRRAWSEVTPPDATPFGSDVAGFNAAGSDGAGSDGAGSNAEGPEASLEWMRNAWQSLEVTPLQRHPSLAFTRPGLRLWSPIVLPILVAAAAAIVFLIVLKRDSVQPLPPGVDDTPLIAAGPTDSSEFDPSEPESASVRPVSLLPDGSFELRRGRVRLIFLGEPQSQASTVPRDGTELTDGAPSVDITNPPEIPDTQDQ
jgi:hypothetical protein